MLKLRLVASHRTFVSGSRSYWVGGTPLTVLAWHTRLGEHEALARLTARGLGDGLIVRLLSVGLLSLEPDANLSTRLSTCAVVIPSLDESPAQLETLMASVRRCLPHSEAVIVRDGESRDDEQILNMASHFEFKVEILPRRLGPASARARGVEATQSEVILFLDADQSPPGQGLDRLLSFFSVDSLDLVAPRILQEGDGEPTRYLTSFPLDLGPQACLVSAASSVRYLPAACLLIRRSVFEALGGFDPEMLFGEDVDMVWKAIKEGHNVLYDPSVVARHKRIKSIKQIFARSFRYGISHDLLAKRHGKQLFLLPDAPALRAAVLAAPFIGPGAIIALVLLARTSLSPSPQHNSLPETVLKYLRWRAQWETVAGIIHLYSKTLLLPLVTLSLFSHRARRLLAAVITLQSASLVHRERMGIPSVLSWWISSAGYSLGVWVSVIFQ